jgi:hypothetical protein
VPITSNAAAAIARIETNRIEAIARREAEHHPCPPPRALIRGCPMRAAGDIAKYSPRAAEYFTHPARSPRHLHRRARRTVGAQPAPRAHMPHPPTALIAVVIAGLASGATPRTASPQDADKSAQSVKQVMTTLTIPASDPIFAAASEPPKDDAQWAALRKNAATLAESGRLLVKTGPSKDNAEWIDMARALVTEAEVTMKAIDAKDTDQLAQIGDDMYLTCKACHDRFDP